MDMCEYDCMEVSIGDIFKYSIKLMLEKKTRTFESLIDSWELLEPVSYKTWLDWTLLYSVKNRELVFTLHAAAKHFVKAFLQITLHLSKMRIELLLVVHLSYNVMRKVWLCN